MGNRHVSWKSFIKIFFCSVNSVPVTVSQRPPLLSFSILANKKMKTLWIEPAVQLPKVTAKCMCTVALNSFVLLIFLGLMLGPPLCTFVFVFHRAPPRPAYIGTNLCRFCLLSTFPQCPITAWPSTTSGCGLAYWIQNPIWQQLDLSISSSWCD